MNKQRRKIEGMVDDDKMAVLNLCAIGFCRRPYRVAELASKFCKVGLQGFSVMCIAGSMMLLMFDDDKMRHELLASGKLDEWLEKSNIEGSGGSPTIGGYAISARGISEFCEFVEAVALSDVPIHGKDFTWFGFGNKCSRLDRFLVSKEWFERFDSLVVNNLPRELSDHSPILLDVLPWHMNLSGQRHMSHVWRQLVAVQDDVRVQRFMNVTQCMRILGDRKWILFGMTFGAWMIL
ncbi:hypothetical protein V6N13_063579 [Hibiscus sabdariffa]